MIEFSRGGSALRLAQRGAIDVHGVAVMAETAQERLDHVAIAEEVGPFVIPNVGCNDCRFSVIALFHEFEEDVRLFRFEI